VAADPELQGRQEAFKRIVTRNGCQIHDDPLDCEYPIQACHLIPKSALKKRGLKEYFWDPRNALGACYKAHRRSDAGLERFPVERIPDAAWDFATELGLDYMLENLYGKRELDRPDPAL